MNGTSLAPMAATAELAKRINSHHAAIVQALSNALNDAMAAGDLLLQVKRQLRHGDWQSWLVDNFDGSARAAQQYVQLAKNRAIIDKSAPDGAVLSVREARRLIAGPPRQPTEAQRRINVPNLDVPDPAVDLYIATGLVGEHLAVVQLEQSRQHPAYWYMEAWHLGSDQTIVSMRAMRFEPGDLAIHESIIEFDGKPFCRRGHWQACDRDDPIIPLIDETIRKRAYLLHKIKMQTQTLAEALEIADQEAAQVA